PQLEQLRDRALAALATATGGAAVLANSAPHARHEVTCLPADLIARSGMADGQHLSNGLVAAWVAIDATTVTPLDAAVIAAADRSAPVGVTETDDRSIVIDNGVVAVTIDGDGLITSVWDHRAEREVILDGQRANVLELSPDTPIEYDAWDLDDYYANSVTEITDVDAIEIVDRGPLVAAVTVRRSFGRSQVIQTIVVRAGSARIDVITDIDWYEDDHVLKVAFPVDVHADTAACEVQYGHTMRPTHASTSWDAAKFEICAHRFVDVSEHGYGVALLNDCK
ncbi:MAG TPA: glycoside hydrolase family 38 C-terminal domain-containing protein, partial [Ilumatobacteraceae bacterium]|nr:glycoside hydrolase family 38 C-terminal domain-containing protein [Ilumatobacteraceae bacterium]